MIDRYSNENMKKIWSLQKKFEYFLKVELAVCDAQVQLGNFPKEDIEKLKKLAKFDINRIDEIEQEVHHDVIAFLTNVKESVGEDFAKYIHVGLTSSDVIDTAFSMQIQDCGKIILNDLEEALKVLKDIAKKHEKTVCVGRSHGIHAEIMTFGLKMYNWFDILDRAKKHFENALEDVRVGQISGPVGTYSNISPKIEQIVCEKLGLKPAKISTQIIARDVYAYFVQSLAMIATVLEQFATEVRHLQRTEVMEVAEGFSQNQKGSSAMPHKKNPILSENLCGLARVVRANSVVALENVSLWHERDISHSSAERIIFPDSTILVDFMLTRFKNLMENLQINEKKMLANTDRFGGVVFSQRVLLKLIEKGMPQEEAYKIVQKHSLSSISQNGNFRKNLENDKETGLILSELEECFDFKTYLENIDEIYKRF